MNNHKKRIQKKQEVVDQEQGHRKKEAEALSDHSHVWDEGTFPITEAPFRPQADQHAALLSKAKSDEHRTNLAIHLQRTYGNRYLQRLLNSMSLQAKLTINPPNDVYEQEADRVAEAVTGALASQAQRQEGGEEEVQMMPFLQRQEEEEEEEVQTMPLLQRQEEEEEPVQAKVTLETQRQELPEEELQAQLAKSQETTVSDNIETRINTASGCGQPLPENVRKPMEQAFGAEFNSVRVHNDSEADALNQQLRAKAFTTGKDIFFRADEYSPGSDSGKKLIAHELTHVIQQIGKKAMRKEDISNAREGKTDAKENVAPVSGILQRKPVPGCVGYGNFSDLGNGLFGTTAITRTSEVSGLVDEIRSKSIQAGIRQNIKVITGTHGSKSGHLVGETKFYSADLVHEGHKVAEAGWINVLNVKGKSKETIENWMIPGTSAIILAWCYSKTSKENWANVHCYKNTADAKAGRKFW